jgi:CheY-like chemotaxis protein
MNRDSRRIETILVVEDYDDTRNLLKLLLERDYHVLEATSGPEALGIAKERYPDLILMDIGLPGFDGLETIRRIRQIHALKEIPIIVLSAYSGSVYYEATVRAGGDYFLTKPIDFDRFQALLRQLDSVRKADNLESDIWGASKDRHNRQFVPKLGGRV